MRSVTAGSLVTRSRSYSSLSFGKFPSWQQALHTRWSLHQPTPPGPRSTDAPAQSRAAMISVFTKLWDQLLCRGKLAPIAMCVPPHHGLSLGAPGCLPGSSAGQGVLTTRGPTPGGLSGELHRPGSIGEGSCGSQAPWETAGHRAHALAFWGPRCPGPKATAP